MYPERTHEPRVRRRRTVLATLAAVILLLFALVGSQTAFNLTFLRPSSSEQTLLFAALSALIFLLLVALTFVLLRNLLKLYAERRTGVLGSRFRTKMVAGALLLSSAPVIFLFLFAYGLMNRSIDKWFSRPVDELREDSGKVASLLSSYIVQNAQAEAAAIAADPEIQRAFANGSFSAVLEEFRHRNPTLHGGFAIAVYDDAAVAALRAPELWGALRNQLPSHEQTTAEPVFRHGNDSFMLGSARVGPQGRIIVGLPLPKDFSETLAQIEANQQYYLQLSAERKTVRRTYMGLLLLLTVLVLFAATWFALFLSKLVTRPVAALAAATQEISRGRLDYRVEIAAADELGTLVQSFNRMAGELELSRRQIESSRSELAEANEVVEQRRRHMETILESIPTGVLSLGAERSVTHCNHAFQRMFAIPVVARGTSLRELFPDEAVADLEHLLRKSERMGAAGAQMEISAHRGKLTAAITAASLKHDGQRLGYVLVFEDLSDLLKAQKQSAWREVARRVAHEIKNPLTPIALSAERIRRHLERGTPPDEQSIDVVKSCAETIGSAVETVRSLVDEFAALARFPMSKPQSSNINQVVEASLAMFDGRLEGITLRTSLAPDLPPVMADPEAIKRAVANLVDNAAEAMQGALVREIQISTALLSSRDAVEIVIADTGHGVTRELKERLFLPYFSTKKRGTGLGLAIVHRIVEEHRGHIRVEENSPMGARFVVELPLAPEHQQVQHA